MGSRRSGWRWLLLIVVVAGVIGCSQSPVIVETDEPREPVEARAMIDRAVATTGDLITYRIQVSFDPAFEVDIPEAGAEIAGFRIVDVGRQEPQEKGGRVIDERWYQLRADLVGSYVLPPVDVGYREAPSADDEPGPWQTLTTSEIFVEVESVLPADGEATDIRGLKPLRQVGPPVPWVGLGLTVLAILLAAAGILWYLRRRARMKDQVPPIPAHELAFRALDALRRIDFDDPEAVRLFYFQISEVVRAYVEGRFGMNATDLTTEEISADLTSLIELAADQSQELNLFLVDTDQVKFAHREPDRNDIEGTYERALSFVEATRPLPEPAEPVQVEREAA